MHHIHIEFDPLFGEFTGLPDEWKALLATSTISRTEIKKNPQAVLDVLEFFSESMKTETPTGSSNGNGGGGMMGREMGNLGSGLGKAPPRLNLNLDAGGGGGGGGFDLLSTSAPTPRTPMTPITPTTPTAASAKNEAYLLDPEHEYARQMDLAWERKMERERREREKMEREQRDQRDLRDREELSSAGVELKRSLSLSHHHRSPSQIQQQQQRLEREKERERNYYHPSPSNGNNYPTPASPASSGGSPTVPPALQRSKSQREPERKPLHPQYQQQQQRTEKEAGGSAGGGGISLFRSKSKNGHTRPPLSETTNQHQNRVNNNQVNPTPPTTPKLPKEPPTEPSKDKETAALTRKKSKRDKKFFQQNPDLISRISQIVSKGDPTLLYSKVKEVGKGGSGRVYLARSKSSSSSSPLNSSTSSSNNNNNVVAIKQIHLASQPRPELILDELSLMQTLHHPNLINCLDSFYLPNPQNELWVVMEFMEIGALTDVIEVKDLEEREMAAVFLQVLKGLKCLHEGNVIHRDIKSDNILLNSKGLVKICK
jgi:protein-serine/threonine kinase